MGKVKRFYGRDAPNNRCVSVEDYAECLEALRLLKETYPYDPPCHSWEDKVFAHREAERVLTRNRG